MLSAVYSRHKLFILKRMEIFKSKILKKCRLPLTAVGVVSMIVTEFAVFSIKDGKMTLLEVAPEVTKEDIRANTEADYEEAPEVKVMQGVEVPVTEEK